MGAVVVTPLNIIVVEDVEMLPKSVNGPTAAKAPCTFSTPVPPALFHRMITFSPTGMVSPRSITSWSPVSSKTATPPGAWPKAPDGPLAPLVEIPEEDSTLTPVPERAGKSFVERLLVPLFAQIVSNGKNADGSWKVPT